MLRIHWNSEHGWESQPGRGGGCTEPVCWNKAQQRAAPFIPGPGRRRGDGAALVLLDQARCAGGPCRRHRRPASRQNRSPGMLVCLGGRTTVGAPRLEVPRSCATTGARAQPNPAQPVPARLGPTQPSPTQLSRTQPGSAQPDPAQRRVVEPSPAQPSPAQPSRAQPSPAQPSPAQPSPAQPGPAQPSPTQPSPAQPSRAQPSPAQPSPAQPSPAQPGPAQPSPTQPSPAQPIPAQPRPARPDPGPGAARPGAARCIRTSHRFCAVSPRRAVRSALRQGVSRPAGIAGSRGPRVTLQVIARWSGGVPACPRCWSAVLAR